MASGDRLLLRTLPRPVNKAAPSPQVFSADYKAEKQVCHSCERVAPAGARPNAAESLFLTRVSPLQQRPHRTERQQTAATAASSSSSFHLPYYRSAACPLQMVDSTTGSDTRGGGDVRVRKNRCSDNTTTGNAKVRRCPRSTNSSDRVKRGARTTLRHGNSLRQLLQVLLFLFASALLLRQKSAAEAHGGQGPPGEETIGLEDGGEEATIGKQGGDGQGFPEAPLPLARLKPTPTRENFTDAASDLLDCVEQLAFTLQHPALSRVHLLACMLQIPGDSTIAGALDEAGGNSQALRKDMYDILIKVPVAEAALSYGEAPPRAELRQVVVQAWKHAAAEKRESVGVQDLVAALLECERLHSRLESLGTDVEKFRSLVAEAYRSHNAAHESERKKKMPEWPRAFGVRLTDLARENKIGKVLGRDHEIAEMQAILSRMTKPNCMLVGEPGVGKTALVEGLAHLIVSGKVSEALLDTEIYSLNVGALVSGSSLRGEFEKRVKALLDYIIASDRRSILFVDEIHLLMGAGKSDGPMDAANLLKPALARGQIRVIGATTWAEYRRYVEKDTAFARRFTVVEVKEPTEAKTVATLRGLRPGMEQHHGLSISDEALEAAARLANRYIHDRHLPDKAIDLLDSACSLKNVRVSQRHALQAEVTNPSEAEQPAANLTDEERTAMQELMEAEAAIAAQTGQVNEGVVTAEDVAYVISSKTGISVHNLTETDKQKLLRLPATLRSRVHGQEEAIQAVASAVMRSRAGLAHRNSPVGTFLFLGPPGVGKTELAKALAAALYGDEKALIRLDMSEFSEAQTATRLIGSPPGYVNHEEGGQLTEAVRARPYSVVLFDELENAHPSVFPYLLQLLDEGRLTDSRGVTVDFRNCIIIATSNVGSQQILDAYEKSRGGELGWRGSIGKFDDVNEKLLLNAEAEAGRRLVEGEDEKKQQFRGVATRRSSSSNRSSNTVSTAAAAAADAGLSGSLEGGRKTDYKASIRRQIEEEAGRRFKPQVVNRMKVVLFDPLDMGKLRYILQASEKELAQLFIEKQIEFEMSDSARSLLLSRACSNSTGARDLRRYFEDLVAGPLSPWLLTGRLLPGMRLLITALPPYKNSLFAQTCMVDVMGRCLPGSRKARLLSTVDPPAA